MLKPSIEETISIKTEAEAVHYISKYINHNNHYVQNEETQDILETIGQSH